MSSYACTFKIDDENRSSSQHLLYSKFLSTWSSVHDWNGFPPESGFPRKSFVFVSKYIVPNITSNFFAAIVTIGQGVVNTYEGLLSMRVLIGVFEANIVPGSILLLSTYYPKYHLQWRLSILMVANVLASAFGGVSMSFRPKNLLTFQAHRLRHHWSQQQSRSCKLEMGIHYWRGNYSRSIYTRILPDCRLARKIQVPATVRSSSHQTSHSKRCQHPSKNGHSQRRCNQEMSLWLEDLD